MSTYRKPGVYLEEGTLTGIGEVGNADAYALFVGAAAQGPHTDATLITSWSDYEAVYGGFTDVTGTTVSYLPYAVWSFYQNGGRNAWVRRAVSDDNGEQASVDVIDATVPATPKTCFTVNALSTGTWGNSLKIAIDIVETDAIDPVFTFYVYKAIDPTAEFPTFVQAERFENISWFGQKPGTKRLDLSVNDAYFGSKYVRIVGLDTGTKLTSNYTAPKQLQGGLDGGVPATSDLTAAVTSALGDVEGPIILNVCGYRSTAGTFVNVSFDPTSEVRGDVFVVNDNFDRRPTGDTSAKYGTDILAAGAGSIGGSMGNSYVAAYVPWIVIPDPAVNGGTILTPPGGAVAGMIARNDATSGVYQAPAGVQFGGINNALNVDAKFTDTMLGALNNSQINVLRPVTGAGIACMGGRTRKTYAVDKYVNARRTLIYLKETLKRSCEFALFQNNDATLWASLRATAEMVLRPVWSGGGLKGVNPSEAYLVVCDATINTPAVVASGEVRMEIAVALQTPAEFIVIRVSQMAGEISITEL